MIYKQENEKRRTEAKDDELQQNVTNSSKAIIKDNELHLSK